MLTHLIKKYIIWMVLSYIVAGLIIHTFLIIPQNNTMAKLKYEKTRIEYDYIKITSSREFIVSMDNTIKNAHNQVMNFTWTDSEQVDAGLNFYNYIYTMAKKANLELIYVSMIKPRSDTYYNEKLYYAWNIRLAGNFPDFIYLIDSIEGNQRFLVVEGISITQGKKEEENYTTYDLTLLGLKKENVDEGKKTEI